VGPLVSGQRGRQEDREKERERERDSEISSPRCLGVSYIDATSVPTGDDETANQPTSQDLRPTNFPSRTNPYVKFIRAAVDAGAVFNRLASINHRYSRLLLFFFTLSAPPPSPLLPLPPSPLSLIRSFLLATLRAPSRPMLPIPRPPPLRVILPSPAENASAK